MQKPGLLRRLFGGNATPEPVTMAQPKPAGSDWPNTDNYPWVIRSTDVEAQPFKPQKPAGSNLIARPPVIDRYPVILGQALSGQALTATYRLANTGWRYQYVDLLNELLEHDPHARAVTRQRVLAVAGGRVQITAAHLPKNDKREKLAGDIAEDFEQQFSNIPGRSQSIGQLNWGLFYGLSGSEIDWQRTDGWEIGGLSNIHSRRLNYPNPTTWDLYIYDQGLVGPGLSYMGPTTGVYGLRVGDFPGKFICHAPALNGDYPTRDGEGRYIGMYMLLKRMVVRASAQDFERTIRPWVVGYFNRDMDDGNPPPATTEDIKALEDALAILGMGSLNSAALPNTVKVELLRAASAMSATEFLSFLNREISKALLGQAFTTEPGANGNLSTSQMAKEGTLEVLRYDGQCIADTLERDLATPWMKLNYPEANRKLLPRIKIMVDELPDPEKVANIATSLASVDVPIDVDELAEMTGMPVVAPDDKKARRTRMVAAGKAESPPPEPGSPEAEAQAAAIAAGVDIAQPKAKTPNGKADADKTKQNGKAKAEPEPEV